MSEIKFGTDGWRGIMDGRDFTKPKVKLVVQAISNHLKKIGMAEKGLIIGYDTRKNSEEFAKACAEVASANGIVSFISERPIPTPLTAFSISIYDAAGAIMLTASHNPPEYNGIKFIPHYCGPATDDITSSIEEELEKLDESDVKCLEFDNNTLINTINPIPEYMEQLKKMIDFNLLRKSGLEVIVDTMHGAASGIIDKAFIDADVKVKAIRDNPDPMFGGDVPEPIEKHLQELIKEVKKEKKLGLALDGDADRFGAVDSKGVFIKANYAMAIIAHYLVNIKKVKGDIARSVATTHLLDLIAKKNNLSLIETRVGFKYLGKEMRENRVAFAGEESAGLSINGHIPEKDGLLAVLLLAEITAYYKAPLSEILKKVFDEYGYLKNDRIDTVLSVEKKERLMKNLSENPPENIESIKVKERNNIDGLKLTLEDGSWLLIRPSGTEPKVRTYIEASSEQTFNKLQQFAKTIA